jgi:glycosyltransferase involved in cell wall biosynthesis
MDFNYFPCKKTSEFIANFPLPDNSFSASAITVEQAYRANRLGIVNTEFNAVINWWGDSRIQVLDEYIFARKYFNPSRVVIAMLLRILTFHNPIKEIVAFMKSRKVKRLRLNNGKSPIELFENYTFKFLTKQPSITVIIPTLNRYNFLAGVLRDLENQDYKLFDVIIVDQSDNFNSSIYTNSKLKLTVIRQEEKALWLARNNAIKNSNSEFIALSEDDIRIPPDWISNHLKCIEFYNADISNGVFFPKGEKIPEDKNIFRWSDQFATGNALLKKSVFNKIGLFDRQFEKQRMGDGEFGLRAYKAGIKSIMNPLAWCEDLKAPTGGLRENGNWDAFRPKNIWSPRPVPSVLYYFRKYFGTKATVLALLINIPPSIAPYRFKRNKKMLALGSILSLILLPLVIVQVYRAWRKSSLMLKNPIIELLDV